MNELMYSMYNITYWLHRAGLGILRSWASDIEVVGNDYERENFAIFYFQKILPLTSERYNF